MKVYLLGGPRDGSVVDYRGGSIRFPLRPVPQIVAGDDSAISTSLPVAEYGGPLLWHPDRHHRALAFQGYRP